MDIQKEREAFEKECRLLCYKGNMVMSNLGSFYNNEQTNWMWQMWLSSKTQAIPKGLVLVSKDTLNKALNPNDYDEAVCSANELLAVIEAQEPSSTLGCFNEP